MKRTYVTPEAETVLFTTEQILGMSDSPILDPADGNSSSSPAEDFGSVNIF